ncbi:MAG: glycosyltransferase family 9 protein [Ktedonobacteraceae bacterium]
MRKIIHHILLLIIRVLGTPRAHAAAKRTRQPVSQQPKILLIHPGPLGALVLTTPVLHALKASIPGVHVTMTVGPGSSEVVTHHPGLDRLLIYNFPSYCSVSPRGLKSYLLLPGLARQLRRDNYDLAINLHRIFWWGAALLYLARIPRRIGYDIQPGSPFLTHALPFPLPEHAAVSRLLTISAGLHALEYPPLTEPYTPECYPLHFQSIEAEQYWAVQFLQSKGIAAATPIVVIHPGTSVEVKQWRPDAWAVCATALGQFLSDDLLVHFLLTGSEKERPLLEEIARGTEASTTIVTDTTVGQLAALLRRAWLVLGVNSGPLHLAAALDTPTVRIFGPNDPRRYRAWGPQEMHAIVITTHRCSTCSSIPCGRLHFQAQEVAAHFCVRLVSEQRVLTATLELLSFIKQPTDSSPVGLSAAEKRSRG